MCFVFVCLFVCLFVFVFVFFFFFYFFFQAEDGIRDTSVTGVQTCALPILMRVPIEVAICSLMLIHIAFSKTDPKSLETIQSFRNTKARDRKSVV